MLVLRHTFHATNFAQFQQCICRAYPSCCDHGTAQIGLSFSGRCLVAITSEHMGNTGTARLTRDPHTRPMHLHACRLRLMLMIV
jgi:hypothetical protein